MRRYLVLDATSLSLWRRGQLVRQWEIGALASNRVEGIRLCDGAVLVVESGCLQSVRVDPVALTSADKMRYRHRIVTQHTQDTCGCLSTVGNVQLVQRIEAAPGLPALLEWAEVQGVRFRRVRHAAQRAEVLQHYVTPGAEAALVGWHCGKERHLTVVLHGVVVWHRRLSAHAGTDVAFDETEAFARERGFFDSAVEVKRAWVGGDDVLADRVYHRAVGSELLRGSSASDRDVLESAAYNGLLDSALSDLRQPVLRSAWRQRAAVRSIATLSLAICVSALLNLWHARSDVQAYLIGSAEQQTHDLGITPNDDWNQVSEATRVRYELANQWESVPGASPADWRTTTYAVAMAMTARPDLRLESFHWRIANSRQELKLHLKRETGNTRLAEVLKLEGWTSMPIDEHTPDRDEALVPEPTDVALFWRD